MTDSSSTRRTETLKERNVVNAKKDLATDTEADVDGSGEAILVRSDIELPEKRGLDNKNVMEKRQNEGFDRLLCATLKELVAEDPARFSSLSSWCDSLTNSATS